MNDTKNPLDGFEQRLLTELRSEIETAPALAPHASRSPKRRLAFTGAALAAGAAAAIAGPLLLGSSHSPTAAAYTVTEKPNGDVTVVVNQAKDADGLEKAFADVGVRARVAFVPFGKKCDTMRLNPLNGEKDGVLPHFEHNDGLVDGDRPATITFDPAELGDLTLLYTIGLAKDSNPDDQYLRARYISATAAPGDAPHCTLVDDDEGN